MTDITSFTISYIPWSCPVLGKVTVCDLCLIFSWDKKGMHFHMTTQNCWYWPKEAALQLDHQFDFLCFTLYIEIAKLEILIFAAKNWGKHLFIFCHSLVKSRVVLCNPASLRSESSILTDALPCLLCQWQVFMPLFPKKAENQHGIPVAKLLSVVAAKWFMCFTFYSVAAVSM